MKFLKNIGFTLLIAILYLVVTKLSVTLVPLGIPFNPNEVIKGIPMLFLGSLIYATLLMYILTRTPYHGFTLIALVSIAWYGITTFMTQIETWYFLKAFPQITFDELFKMFIRGLVATIILIPLATLTTGKLSGGTNPTFSWKMIFNRNLSQILSLTVVAYLLLYFLAGYFIAWQFEAVRIHYTGSPEKLSFIGQMTKIVNTDTPLISLQVIRAILWFGFGIPLFLLFRERKIECIIISALTFGLLPTAQLLYYNPVMPYAVRMAHFIEVSISTGILGGLVSWLWLKYNNFENQRYSLLVF